MEDYTQPNNDAVDFTLEDYSQPNNDDVDFTPVAVGEEPGFDVTTDPLDLPMGIDLPMAPLNLTSMQTGVALFLVGLLATLGGIGAFLRNYAAIIMLTFAVFAMLSSGLFQIGLELFWIMIAATVFLLMVGAVVRWTS